MNKFHITIKLLLDDKTPQRRSKARRMATHQNKHYKQNMSADDL
jgi:hypothetical protein